METQLDPVTFYKLKMFARRRNRLIAVRGICALVAAVLAAMGIVAAVDLVFVLPNAIRFILSLIAYGFTFAVFYATCLRWFLHPADLRDLACMFEEGHEELEEHVLSAVELGEPAKKIWDSEQLRAVLQKQVAALVRRYRLKWLLPASLVRKWVLSAVVIVAVSILLGLVPGLEYPKLIARAFAPTANIARVSMLKIHIVDPNNPETVVPRGDPVGIVAELSEPWAEEVYIESFMDGQERELVTIQMEPIGNQRFAATLVAARDSLTYRVFAGRASTRYYTVQSRQRPHATRFHKTYHYPAYSKLKDIQAVETTGDVKALQGSSVDLKIEVDQPVSEAQLRIEIGQKKQTVPLSTTDGQLLHGQIAMQESGTYQVHLVARETGFENKFAPYYEISVVPDLVPSVTIEKPEKDLILPSDGLVRLEGSAKDDLGLESVKQMIRVNSGLWKENTLATDTGRDAQVKRDWDLLEMELKPGDQVLTKLVATDLRGNRGESLVTQITISSPGFSVQGLEALARQRNLLRVLGQLRDSAKDLREWVENLEQDVKKNPDRQDQHRQSLVPARTMADRVETQAQAAWASLRDIMRQSEVRREADDMMLVGRFLSRLRHDTLDRAHRALRYDGTQGQSIEPSLKLAREATGTTDGYAEQLYRSHRFLLTLQEAQRARQEVERLRANQEKILSDAVAQAEDADDAGKAVVWRRLARQQQAAVREQEIVEQMLDALAEHAESGQRGQAENTRKKLEKQRLELEATLKEQDPSADGLTQRSQAMRDALADASRGLLNIERTALNNADRTREELARSLGRTADEVAQVKWKLDNLVNQRDRLQQLQSQPNVEARQVDEQRARTTEAMELADSRWSSTTGQLKERSRLEDVQPSPSYLFVDDTANTAAAIEGLEVTAVDTPSMKQAAQALARIEKAYRTLEAGNDIDESWEHLQEMIAQERWKLGRFQNSKGKPQSSKMWNLPVSTFALWALRLSAVPKELNAVGIPGEIGNTLHKLLDSGPVKSVRQEAAQRQNVQRGPEPVAEPMEAVASDLAQVRDQMQPYLEEARKVIAEYAPSLIEQLRAVSQQSEQLKEKTAELTEGFESRQGDELRQQTRERLADQLSLNERLDTVRDALRRDANIQDLATNEGRERARDADDSIAMLRQPPPKAEDLLRQAVSSRQPEAQQGALEQAVTQQAKLSDALELITQHYENLDAGQPDQTRLALRQAEQQMLVAGQMDGQYGQLDQLAEMAQMPPNELKTFLEERLPQNPGMQSELGQIVSDTLQEATESLGEMVEREDRIAKRLDQIAEGQNQQDQQIAQQDQRLRDLTERAQQLARGAEHMARNEIPQASQKAQESGVSAEPLFNEAATAAGQAAQQIPQSRVPLPKQLSDGVRQFADRMDGAREDLQKAAAAAEAAARQSNLPAAQAMSMTRDAEQRAAGLSEDARKIASELEDLMQQRQKADRTLAQADAREQELTERAHALARQAEELATQEIAQVTQAARPIAPGAMDDFGDAMQVAKAAAEQMPTDLSAPAAAFAEQVDDFADAMNQTRQDLQDAAGKTDQAANNENRQAARAASRQARSAAQKATNLGKQANQLARDLRDLAGQQSARLDRADQRQREINEMAPEVVDDVTRAAIHAQNLQRNDAGSLQKAGEALQSIAEDELPQAQQALDRARRARQAQPEVNQAHDALAGVLESLEEMQEPVGGEQGMIEGAAAQPSDETAQWMARALDRLQAAELAANSQQIVQGAATQQAQQAIQQPLQAQQVAMAQGRAEQMMPAQTPAMTRDMLSAMMSGNKMTNDMPPPTDRELPEEVVLLGGEWGKLRQLNAKEMMEAQTEAVAEEYRAMVSTYFRVVSERAKQSK
jgi:hypothetical protein